MTLLYIDDDDDDRTLFSEAMHHFNQEWHCMLAESGEKAFIMLKSISPDVIFLDLNMPKMDGREVLKEIRKNPKWLNVPVVMISTTILPNEGREFREIGADECIVKPSSFKGLCNLLSSLFVTQGSNGRKRVENLQSDDANGK